MLLIGLCGGTGAGKGYIGALFRREGITVIDTDAVWRSLTGPRSAVVGEISAALGICAARADGSLDRAAVARAVFAGTPEAEEARKKLNAISHAAILAEVKRIAAERMACGDAAVVIDAPLLYESGFDRECDAVVRVTAPVPLRIERIRARDNITKEAAAARIKAQSNEEKLAEAAGYTIVNDGRNVEEQVRRVLEKLGIKRSRSNE